MKKGRLKDLEDRYWEGKTSLEEEKYLKSMAEDPFFQVLSEQQKNQLEWRFENFLEQAEDHRRGKSEQVKRKVIPFWRYAGIAAALLILVFIFLKDREPKISEQKPERYTSQEQIPPDGDVTEVLPTHDNPFANKEREQTVAVALPEKKQPHLDNELSVPHQPRIEIAREAYVLVNGKPVYDEEEAEKIVLASLQIMANNFQEGKEAIGKMKHIKIEL